MSKVTTSQRLSALQQWIFEFEIDLLHYFDLTDTQKDVVKDRVSFLMNYVERMKGEIEQ